MAIDSRTPITIDGKKIGEEIVVSWTSDGSGDATQSIEEMTGYLIQMITVPGSAAPTDNYDITLVAPQGSSLDVLGGVGANRSTSSTQAVAVYLTSAPTPPFLNGTYTFTVANAGASKTGTATLILNYGGIAV